MDAPRKTTHRISRPGVLVAIVGFLLAAYSIRLSRAGEGPGFSGIAVVMLTSTLGALLLQGGIGLCMVWFMATNTDQDGRSELSHSASNSGLKGVNDEKTHVGTQGSSPNSLSNDAEKLAPTPSLPSTDTLQGNTQDKDASSTSIPIEHGEEPDAQSPKSISKLCRSSLLNFSLWALGIATMVSAAVLRLYDEEGVLTTDTLRCRLAIAAPAMNFLSLLLTMYQTCKLLRLADRKGLEKWLNFR
ncbi:hypothetical protein B5807_00252 [Epicoccum nigrum]|uniref:Uncharacterized protein n=1 Tax=Epicoccum nigrum TaxID=105696 RepID=A0A1Y2MF02_EPING|nr:hypothetical protein B5807_00252 [Epicoccum nigrum]